jgi:hypothetical protein
MQHCRRYAVRSRRLRQAPECPLDLATQRPAQLWPALSQRPRHEAKRERRVPRLILGDLAQRLSDGAVARTMGCTNEWTQSIRPTDRQDASARQMDAAAVSRRICAGSSSIRFAYAFPASSFEYQTSVLYDLGSDFLYVDGACHYWVDEPSITPDEYKYWRAVREGTLTQDQEAALHAAVGYDDFSKAPGQIAASGVSLVNE